MKKIITIIVSVMLLATSHAEARSATSGWSITEIATQGGWRQLQVLKRYTHIKAEYLAKKMK